jgi:hypothetical protein
MDTDKSMRAALDAEIDRLEQARALLDCLLAPAELRPGESATPEDLRVRKRPLRSVVARAGTSGIHIAAVIS